MEFSIKGKNIELTEEVEKYAQRRLDKLSRHLPNIAKIKVELTQEKTKSSESRYTAQVTIDHQGTLLRGEESAADIFTAIDAVIDMVSRQVERYKGKLYDRRKRPLSLRGRATIEEEPTKVVKVKHFPIKPMSPDEAIEQMELLGHNFFLFLNQDTSQLSVLYRRRDGNYGLIEPELG
jgi:putative sigma-54 modulation protein